MRRGRGFTLAALALASPAWARDPILSPPIDCDLTGPCFIQQYVDADPGAGAADFTCGPLTYDGHKGTDFALPSRAMLEAGVDVLAAAPGTVRALRDGMADVSADAADADTIEGRDCGNGVAISHGGGWETQYCHLRQGSIAVSEGQRVGTGTVLGQVGLSGRTVFPHVHLSVRQDGRVIDPFNPDGIVSCGEPDPQTLWGNPLTYQPGGLIAAGFSDAVPDYDAIKAGTAGADTLGPDADALVVWAYAFGARPGDILRLELDGPDGTVISQAIDLEKAQAQLFRAIGKRQDAGGWPTGSYRGTATMLRKDRVLDEISVTLRVE
ncbi:M23 family metallopeptidase [Maribius pontilimi]|uniref:M23 family metallopeptidase n=1 Tax=Palleronia pontilimi TaxID=1964209 RepID=A0A934IIW6_9RHOB|nr:M23 family metallopeptidase [Palleronia pontilimi]MBJ3763400.1 M23 family metallopeptidase [Palleronia pontilimi]